MTKLYCRKHIDNFIRQELGTSVRSEIHNGALNEAIKKIIYEAKSRMEKEGRKTILKHHL